MKTHVKFAIAATLAAVSIALGWWLLQMLTQPKPPAGKSLDDSLLRMTDTPATASGYKPGETAQTPGVASKGDLPQQPTKTPGAAVGTDAGDDGHGNAADDDDEDTPAERAVKEWEDFAEKLMEAEFAADPRLPSKLKEALDAIPPGEDREYAMHVMMNLISDGAVQALVPILMDTSYDEDLLDIIFNDILNRDDEIKYPILEEIAKNPEHPNFADAAHILEVTQPDEGPVVVDDGDDDE